MKVGLAAALIRTLVGLHVLGCGAGLYMPPASDAPSALLKVRLVHHASAPGDLTDQVWINDDALWLPQHSTGAALSRAARVSPGPAEVRARAVFSHVDPMRRNDPYPWPTGRCGTDRQGRPLICSTPPPTAMQSLDDPEVIDAVCETALRHAFAPGTVYLVRFDFYASDYCTARCLVQRFEPDGRFQLTPCPKAPPANTTR